ncbi:MAG: cbb3-type cytochrome c oxidase subunit I, partial [Actinomycetota bacterium]
MDFHFRNESGGPARRHATLWLALATCSVAVSGMFAILIALARVPALGNLFPGPEFYRVALTLHVNLSQGVWFMAFAGVLWSLSRAPGAIDRLAWLAAALGATGMALSVSVGRPMPLMSNYLPVLDSPAFLSALCLFGFGVALKSLAVAAGPLRQRIASVGDVQGLALRVAAVQVVAVLVLIVAAGAAIDGRLEGHGYFETLFWAGGHVWQFALLSLLMFCWLELAPGAARSIHPRKLAAPTGRAPRRTGADSLRGWMPRAAPGASSSQQNMRRLNRANC